MDDKKKTEGVVESNPESTKKRDKAPKHHDGGDNAMRGIFQTYRAEYNKIVWPSRQTLIKHTVTVITVSLIFGAYIALNDGVFSMLFNQFVRLVT